MSDWVRSRGGERAGAALLAYALALAGFLLGPPFLRASFGPPAAFTFQEAADLLTPLVVIPLAWWVLDSSGSLGRAGFVAFLVAGAMWVEGQGIHLAANAIGDAFGSHADAAAFYATAPGVLSHWLDEELSHWLWHVGWAGLSVLLLAAGGLAAPVPSWASGGAGPASWCAGVVHGATAFTATVEGGTTPLWIPVTLLLLAGSVAASVGGRSRTPVVAFFAVSSTVTAVAYVAWAAAHGWTLPELCGTLLSC